MLWHIISQSFHLPHCNQWKCGVKLFENKIISKQIKAVAFLGDCPVWDSGDDWVYRLSFRLWTLHLRPDTAKTTLIALLGKCLEFVSSQAEMFFFSQCPLRSPMAIAAETEGSRKEKLLLSLGKLQELVVSEDTHSGAPLWSAGSKFSPRFLLPALSIKRRMQRNWDAVEGNRKGRNRLRPQTFCSTKTAMFQI